MSGMEIIGVVLGSASLVFSSMEHLSEGRDAVRRWQHHDEEWKDLLGQLKTEHRTFLGVCEILFRDIVNDTELETMVHDPTTALWKEKLVQRMIKLRLDNNLDNFKYLVHKINEGILTLRKKLGVDPNDQKKIEQNALVSQFERMHLAFRHSSYLEILSDIRLRIGCMRRVVSIGIELEEEKKRSAQAKLISILRDLSLGLYHALEDNLSCDQGHMVQLRLEAPATHIFYAETESERLQELQLQFSISCLIEMPGIRGTTVWSGGPLQWFRAEGLPQAAPPDNPPRLARSRKLQDYIAPSLASTSTESPIRATKNALNITPRKCIKDLCSELKNSPSPNIVGPLGTIVDARSLLRRSFDLHTVDAAHEDWSRTPLSTITLRRALESGEIEQQVSNRAKIELAVDISTGILQLSRTPWLPSMFSADDIAFGQRDQVYEVFLIKRFSDVAPRDTYAGRMSSPRNLTLLSLGFVLVELFFGCSLFKKQTQVPLSIEEAYQMAQTLLPELSMRCDSYYRAVSRCLSGHLHEMGGISEHDQDMKVYTGVVALLEEELNKL